MSFFTNKAKNNKASTKKFLKLLFIFSRNQFFFGPKILKGHKVKKIKVAIEKVTLGILKYVNVAIFKSTFSTFIMQLQLQQQFKNIFFTKSLKDNWFLVL